jgi:hypothetical protein
VGRFLGGEGRESNPPGNLTIPRLVLKTSGTTGHLPSPAMFSITYDGPPILFINSFFDLRGPEGVGNASGMEIDIPLVDLHRAVAARFHGHVYGDPPVEPIR